MYRTKTEFGSQPLQMNAGEGRQKIGPQTNDAKSCFLNPSNSLTEHWNPLPFELNLSRRFDRTGILGKRQHEGPVVVNLLSPKVAEPRLGTDWKGRRATTHKRIREYAGCLRFVPRVRSERSADRFDIRQGFWCCSHLDEPGLDS